MSEIQRVCGTARVSYMCACGDRNVPEACCRLVSAECLRCAPGRVYQNVQTLGHVSPERVGAPL